MKTIENPTKPVLIKDLGIQYPTEKSKQKKRFGLYKCNCGSEFRAEVNNVKNGTTKSCGCYMIKIIKDRSITHGLSNNNIYRVWSNMLQRCNNPKNKRYKDYGERGIYVCSRWTTFENFRDDMFSTWEEGLSLDRIDVNGNYEPSNCRWANNEVQARNTQLFRSDNKSGYRGSSFHKKSNKWAATISVCGIKKHLGLFCTALEAAVVYDNYVINNKLEHTINGVS
jgi:hypothetical protein